METRSATPLDGAYPLTPDQLSAYRENGHVRLEGVVSAEEMAPYREAILAAAMAHNRENRPLEERDTYGKAFLQIMNLWTVDAVVQQFVFAKRFAQIAAQLLEVDSVRLYHDQALFKEPGGGHTPWHQDQFYWPVADARTVTLWMPLIDVSAVMGSMSFADGSHRDGFIRIDNEISDLSEAFFEGYVRGKGYPVTAGGAMAAGDATFHSGWTLHRAPGNVTETVREVMTIIYLPADAQVTEPTNAFQQGDLATWLDGAAPGSLAAGPLNPILWP